MPVRFNPVDDCECPPFEVFAYGGWQRAFVDEGADALTRLQDADPLAQVELSLRLDKPRRAANGVDYPVWIAATPPR